MDGYKPSANELSCDYTAAIISGLGSVDTHREELNIATSTAVRLATYGALDDISCLTGEQLLDERSLGCDGICTTTSSLSSIDVDAVQNYRKLVNDDQKYLEKIKEDCRCRANDVLATNRAINSLSAFLSIPALIGYLSKLACARNIDFLHRHHKISLAVSRPTEAGFQSVQGIDKISYIEFVNRYMLKKNLCDWAVEDGIAKILYGMVRCGLLHGNTLRFNKAQDAAAFQNVDVGVTHSSRFNMKMSDLDCEISSSNGRHISLALNAEMLCSEIVGGIDNMFMAANKDADLRNSICEVFMHDPPICFVDFNGLTKSLSIQG